MPRSFLILALVLPALAPAETSPDKQLARMKSAALAECNHYRAAGGQPGAADDPALKWSRQFWSFREEHAGTPAAAGATAQAIGWLLFAHRPAEEIALAEKMGLDEPAWEQVMARFADAARKLNDYAAFDGKSEAVLAANKNPKVRAAVQVAQGVAWGYRDSCERARRAYEAAIREAPESPAAAAARRHLRALDQLADGQAAPSFEARTTAGARLDSAGLRGKVVLLNFWVSW